MRIFIGWNVLTLSDQNGRHESAEPVVWPGMMSWVGVSRRNAFHLFPDAVYSDFRVIRASLFKRLSVVSDPAAIRDICGRNNSTFALTNLQLRILKPSLGAGVIVAEGESWRRQRRMSLSLTSRARMLQVSAAPSATGRAGDSLPAWAAAELNHAGRDLHPPLLRLSLNMLAGFLFGPDAEIADDALVDAMNEHRRIIEKYDLMDALGVPAWLPSVKMLQAKRTAARYDRRITAAIRDARSLEKGKDRAPPEGVDRDFVVSLITGSESVANVCLWALFKLAESPALLQRLGSNSPAGHETSLRPVSFNAPVTDELDAFILEVMRLYPPLPFIYRKAIKAHDGPAGSFQAGELVCMSPWIVHRHRQLWAHPETFDPERWMGTVPDSLPEFIPFGVGSRQCVGKHVGSALIRKILGYLVANYRFALRDGERPPLPRGGISLRPDRIVPICAAPRRDR